MHNDIVENEVVGKSIDTIFSGNYLNLIKHLLEKNIGDTKKSVVYFDNLDRSKAALFIQYTGSLSEDIGVFSEIALEEKNLDKALWKEKETLLTYLNNIVDYVPASIYWKDKNSLILGGSQLHAELTGCSDRKEAVGKSDYEFIWKEQAERIIENDKFVMSSNQTSIFEETAKLRDGNLHTFLTRKSPLKGKTSKTIGVLGVSLDITELKETQAKLEISLKKAEVANQAKTEFLENMRHDIRTPLSGIVGCARLIQTQSNNPRKVEEYAIDLVDSSNALLEFLNKILESIQVATGEIPLLRQKFSLYKILEQVIRLNKPQADVKNLNLYFDYDKNISPYVLGDSIRLQRIVLELVTNALKYTNKGEIIVSARLIEKKKRELIIELRVSDTGIGIPRDKHHEIYTRFTRLTPSYQGIYSGTGLGLSVVKQFVDDLKGEIQLDSQPNRGSTFMCFIPLQESLSPASNESEIEKTLSFAKGIHILTKKTSQAPAPQAIPVTTGSRVLVVVEDNPIAARVAQGALLELNCQTDIAPDGKMALNLVERNYYDLILMDIGLPDGDGCDVTRRIRLKQWQSNPSVPIIGLTAHTVKEKKKRCLENGMNAIYSKPLTPEKAAEILSVFLSHSQSSILKENRDELPYDLQSFPLLDKEKALKLLGDKETLYELLELLESSLEKEIVELKQYHQDKDWQGIGKMAHKWKGGAGYCGANRLEQICTEIGTVLRAESLEESEILYQVLLQVVEETKEAAKKIITSDK
ncbi:ATP-binding protein [Candidatus Rickettsiella viridis]|nr:ATP-binding protein [Candidatus Rickettsiella viridis]